MWWLIFRDRSRLSLRPYVIWNDAVVLFVCFWRTWSNRFKSHRSCFSLADRFHSWGTCRSQGIWSFATRTWNLFIMHHVVGLSYCDLELIFFSWQPKNWPGHALGNPLVTSGLLVVRQHFQSFVLRNAWHICTSRHTWWWWFVIFWDAQLRCDWRHCALFSFIGLSKPFRSRCTQRLTSGMSSFMHHFSISSGA